ncbi:MAG: hypothetical protein ABH829_05685 [archaeon]
MDRRIPEIDAEKAMRDLGSQREGIEIMLPKAKFRLILIEKVPAGSANILKQTMLSAGGDAAVAAGTVTCKVKQTDVLLLGTVAQYRRAVGSLRNNVHGCPEFAARIEKLLG